MTSPEISRAKAVSRERSISANPAAYLDPHPWLRVDEPVGSLGASLKLPPQFELRRKEIEAAICAREGNRESYQHLEMSACTTLSDPVDQMRDGLLGTKLRRLDRFGPIDEALWKSERATPPPYCRPAPHQSDLFCSSPPGRPEPFRHHRRACSESIWACSEVPAARPTLRPRCPDSQLHPWSVSKAPTWCAAPPPQPAPSSRPSPPAASPTTH